jgi:hypothetical protein
MRTLHPRGLSLVGYLAQSAGKAVARQAYFDRSNQMTVAIPKSLGSKGLKPLVTTTDFVTLTP